MARPLLHFHRTVRLSLRVGVCDVASALGIAKISWWASGAGVFRHAPRIFWLQYMGSWRHDVARMDSRQLVRMSELFKKWKRMFVQHGLVYRGDPAVWCQSAEPPHKPQAAAQAALFGADVAKTVTSSRRRQAVSRLSRNLTSHTLTVIGVAWTDGAPALLSDDIQTEELKTHTTAEQQSSSDTKFVRTRSRQ